MLFVDLTKLSEMREPFLCKYTFKDTLADKALKAALINKQNVKVYSYLDRGSDERQYCSPRLRLPICLFSKSKVENILNIIQVLII